MLRYHFVPLQAHSWFCFFDRVFTTNFLSLGDKPMANQEHVRLLSIGVSAFNAWRAENPTTIPDLNGVDLSHRNLRRANLAKAILNGANFSGAILTDANFTGANLYKADFTGTDLTGANLTGVTVDLCSARSLLPLRAISKRLRDVLVEHIDSLVVD